MDDAGHDATRSQPPVVADATSSHPPTLKGQPHFASHSQPIERGETFVDEAETYAIENQIGAGGMGTVLAARGSRFGRPVALKVVTADREDLRRRFEREAQVTARLQHPAIVPVYGSGRGRNGQPFYAMKQVSGQPLDQVIAKATTLASRIALLPNVIAVTDAIAYAHAQRVIHRDLKPANILVGAFGETVVIDWGLAKDLTRTDDDAGAESPYRTSDAGADATAIGKVMGTPAYMPLEQAQGEPVDERADVYALGAILYHLLHGAPPYLRADERGVPWETMVARVLADVPPSLESLEPEVRPDLLAIVRRAMAREPGDRYPSAGELAADLRRFQTGQLVGAHRYSTWQLVKRWLRRYRTAVTVGAAAVVVLAVISAISIQRIRRERGEAEAARVVAEEQRGLAVASRNEAEDLMGFMLGDLKDKLAPVGKLDIIDAVAKKSMAYYQRQPDTGTEPERRKRAQAFVNVGDVLQAQGNLDGALAAFRSALTIREALARSPNDGKAAMDPADQDRRADYAISHERVGDALFAKGDASGALAEYKAALELELALVAVDPRREEHQQRVARGHAKVGEVLGARGEGSGALQELQTYSAIAEALAVNNPANPDRQRDLEVSYNVVADVLVAQGDFTSALAKYRAALGIAETLEALDPRNAVRRRDTFVSHVKIGEGLLTQSAHAPALVEFRAALAIAEALALADPTSADRKRDLSSIHIKVADVLLAQDQLAPALVELKTALDIRESLAAKDSTNADRQRDLSVIHERLGDVLLAQGRNALALAEYRAALAIDEKLAANDPSNADRQSDLSFSHDHVGNVLAMQGEHALALAEYRAALAIDVVLSAKDPANFDRQASLAEGHSKIAAAVSALGDQAKALAEYELALDIAQRVQAKDPNNGDYRKLAESLAEQATRARRRVTTGVR
jgi:serine/threonine protein kinase/tetratricopeptide (TPR) repeat protein